MTTSLASDVCIRFSGDSWKREESDDDDDRERKLLSFVDIRNVMHEE